MPLSVRLPFRRDRNFGFAMNETHREVVKQNFKHLLLTAPGERVMIPDFGVGLRNYLFENATLIRAELASRIQEQTNKYMPFITLQDISIKEKNNEMTLKITYFIEPMAITDNLEIKKRGEDIVI